MWQSRFAGRAFPYATTPEERLEEHRKDKSGDKAAEPNKRTLKI